MKFPIEMYRICKEDMKIKVPCELCLEKGIVDKKCHKCGGNGVHNKTIEVWKVARKTVTVYEINRSSKDSYYHGVQTTYEDGLRYWTSADEFYNEDEKYLHFNKDDAQKECDKRNIEIADILNTCNKNNQNKCEVKDLKKDIYYIVYLKEECIGKLELTTIINRFCGKFNRKVDGTLWFELNGSGALVIVPENWIECVAPSKELWGK